VTVNVRGCPPKISAGSAATLLMATVSLPVPEAPVTGAGVLETAGLGDALVATADEGAVGCLLEAAGLAAEGEADEQAVIASPTPRPRAEIRSAAAM
jgi:hypothetical protein